MRWHDRLWCKSRQLQRAIMRRRQYRRWHRVERVDRDGRDSMGVHILMRGLGYRRTRTMDMV